ncbi:MAG: MATE family efflux transporter [Eubacteriales bacterium]|nr:MATE family efflux transporter [Eubacteriales bacterium]
MLKDMTKGNPYRLLVAFALPLLLSNVFQQLYNMVDSIVVGRGVGVEALAAVGVTGALGFLVIGFVTGLSQGFSILVSQSFGAGDTERLKKAVATAVYLSAVAAVAMTIAALLCTPAVLRWMHTPENILPDAQLYISIVFGGLSITVFYNLFAAVLRALGDSRTPFYAMLVSSAVNIALDILFVMAFGWGVAGVAVATLIAQAVSVLLCWLKISRLPQLHMERRHWQVEAALLGRMLGLGVPVALQSSAMAVGSIVLQYVVNGYGSDYIAAYTAAFKVISLMMQPGVTLGLAMGTFVGQNAGAGQFARIRRGMRSGLVLSLGVGVGMGLGILLASRALMAWMVSPQEQHVIGIARLLLAYTSTMLWVVNALFVYRAAVQGMGNTLLPMLSGVVEMAMRLASAILLPRWVGFHGICAAEVLAWSGAALLLAGAYAVLIRARAALPATQTPAEV